MNILADENMAWQVVERLRADGHVVTTVAELAPSSDDEIVLALSRGGQQVLLTDDKDFGELIYLRRLPFVGGILARLAALPNDDKAELVARVIREHGAEIPGAFTVITSRAVRIRQQPA